MYSADSSTSEGEDTQTHHVYRIGAHCVGMHHGDGVVNPAGGVEEELQVTLLPQPSFQNPPSTTSKVPQLTLRVHSLTHALPPSWMWASRWRQGEAATGWW